jgi:hypothetical protein
MEWLLELALIGLLAVTLFHALRLERALGVLRRDRAALEELVIGFNSSTRAAEQGVERLHAAADGAGRQIARHIDGAAGLKDDLQFLMERGNRLADQLDHLVRAGRPLAQETHSNPRPQPRGYAASEPDSYAADEMISAPSDADGGEPRVRSQAERELLKALRMAR